MTCLTTHPLSINPLFWLYMLKDLTLPISMYHTAQQLLFCGICSQLIPECVLVTLDKTCVVSDAKSKKG